MKHDISENVKPESSNIIIKNLKESLKLKKQFWQIFIPDLFFVFVGFWIVAFFAWILRLYLTALSAAGENAANLNTYLSQGIYLESLSGDLAIVKTALNEFLIKAIPTAIIFSLIMIALYSAAATYGWSSLRSEKFNIKKFNAKKFRGYFLLSTAWFSFWTIIVAVALFGFKEETNVYLSIFFIALSIHIHTHVYYSFDELNFFSSIKKGILRAFTWRGLFSSIAVIPIIWAAIILTAYSNSISTFLFLSSIFILIMVISYSKILIYFITCSKEKQD